MSDKSFGDHTSRNIVKNPLLSSAVTGLSLEDLTHKAVLLPVSPSLGQITRPDQQQGSQTRTLAHTDREPPTFPSGDALSNITLSKIPQITNPNILDSQHNVKLEKNRDAPSVTQSKASAKSDDDFDVNEYIARLQGSRYVSAPLHSHLKEDKNANLEATEENLEEINLNESQSPEVQQSLTADIAQNFSQLPTVLPQVASAVFSSFSNMLSYKSREQTPDHPDVIPAIDQRGSKGGYDDVQFQRPDVGIPMMGMEDYGAPKEVAPPPKEPPIGGTGNFRITKKKKYAQIPGLSSGDAAQNMTYNAPVQNISIGQNMPPIGQNIPPIIQNIPAIGQNILAAEQNVSPIVQSIPSVAQNITPIGQNMPYIGQNMPSFAQNYSQIGQNMPPYGQNIPTVDQNVPTFFNPNVEVLQHIETASDAEKSHENTQFVAESHSEYNIFNPTTESQSLTSAIDVSAGDSQQNVYAVAKDSQTFFTPIQHKEQAPPQNIPPNPKASGSASIIPPPPMFSNLPKRDSQSSIGKSILPPSVARRISANQPIVKPAVSTPSFLENIFVPAPVSEPANENTGQAENVPTGLCPSAFVAGYTTPVKLDPIEPPSSIPPSIQMKVPPNVSLPVMSQVPATYFIPSNEEKPQIPTDVPSFFTPKDTALPIASTSKMVSSSAISATATSTLPPAFSKAVPTNVSPFESTASNISASNIVSMNAPLASSVFTLGGVDMKTESAVQPSIFQPPLQNLPPPPTFFNPLQHTESTPKDVLHPITQMPPMATPEPPKPVAEPPKATGNVSFRMTKKRPQYYAGPIEGVGAISNNVKPIIAAVIPSATPTEIRNFQAALFTPEQPIQPAIEQYPASNVDQASMPFDINRPMENVTSHTQFTVNKPREQAYGSSFNMSQPDSQHYGQEYNTAFDMSRAATDTYDPPKQESRGFGIIGSLKSKLSSIDINKIQSTVSTFFDPAYNEAKMSESATQDNIPYGQQQYGHQQQQFGQSSQEQSNFDIFTPNVEQNQYSQFKHVGYDYNPKNQYYQTPYSQTQGQNVYSTSSYFTNTNYSTEQVYSDNPLYDNTQTHMPDVTSYTQESIPEKEETLNVGPSKSVDKDSHYNPNTFTQDSMTQPTIGQQQPPIDTASQNIGQIKSDAATTIIADNSQQNVIYFDTNLKNNSPQNIQQYDKPAVSVMASEQDPKNITFYNPNEYVQENRPVRQQQAFDLTASFSRSTTDQHSTNTVSVSESEKSQEPRFYNPRTFTIENQQILKTQQPLDVFGSDTRQKTYQINEDFTTPIKTTRNTEISSHAICDSALNTNKYNMSSIQTRPVHQHEPPRVPLLSAASFFDNPQTINLPHFPKDNEKGHKISAHALTKDDTQPVELQQEQFECKQIEINKILADTPIPSVGSTSIIGDFTKTDKQNKDREVEKEQLLRERNLIESLSKDDIPILGVSTVPLFGLSAMIADKSREISESEKAIKNVSIFESAQQPLNIFEVNTAVSFFENMTPENKLISESQVKEIPLDITGLSISDVKNVLVIEPPQKNIGALLKRNASSSKLESLPKTEQALPEHFGHECDILQTDLREKLSIKFNENTSEIFFKHSYSAEKGEEDIDVEKDASVENKEGEEVSELNICETCREVNTPDLIGPEPRHKESEDLSTQMIENITSRMQLSNPLTVPLKENDTPIDERCRFDNQQFEDITHVVKDTIEMLQVQSAIELLDDNITTSDAGNYGWTTQDAAYLATAHIDHDYGTKVSVDVTVPKEHDIHDIQTVTDSTVLIPAADNDYEFKLDPNAIGFFGDNSLFFDNLPTNASDEIKAEIKHSHEDIDLPRQMSVPSAPPAEDDTKSDETGGGLDVLSIEQDAKKDFPLEEEFIIEPSETDDDKIEFRERKRSSEDSTSNDTFTNRVERFKKATDNPNDDAFEQKEIKSYKIKSGSPPISMASYFDTGNYAVESHYKNSLNSPTSIKTFQLSSNIRIPPGFEEEFARRLSGLSLSSSDSKNEPYIPETSTQTRPISTPTYSSPQDTKENVIGFEMRRKENIEAFAEVFAETKSATKDSIIITEGIQTIRNPIVTADTTQIPPAFADTTAAQSEIVPQNVHTLTDPMNFFSAKTEETKPETESAPENFNRLASYFSMPPAQPEHSKSFFELSQSQNHYRHESKTQESNNKNVQKPFFELSQSQNHYIDDGTKDNITDLMKDLTSPQNIYEQVVRTVNYFTVEYDNDIKHNTNAAPINIKIFDETNINLKLDDENKIDTSKLVENDPKDSDAIVNCKYCLQYIPGFNIKNFKVRTTVNDNPQATTELNMKTENDSGRKTTTINFGNYDVEGQAQDSVTVQNEVQENRSTSEYIPVKHHWFYRMDVEEKSVWRGFSLTDSIALEEAYDSPDLNESTLVATDGGRYDVNVVGRLRLAVYWKQKPTNVRRCSWFYKGTTDARYVPYTEAVAEKLEEEYRHGVTTGEWHRKLALPNSEMVIMHGPAVMVHFLHSGATDAFSTPPNLLGKTVYRNPPKIRVARDQPQTIDHLILLVHGAGEYKRYPYLDQTTSRPRVVRRGHEESEIEDSEPSRIDHLLLLCHGVGSACDMRFRSVEEVVEDFRATTLQLLQSHYRNSFDNGVVSRVEVLPISWHDQLHSGENGVDRRLSRVTLDSIPRLRAFTNHTVLDVLFYTSPVFHQTIIDTVCSELNRIYGVFKQRNPQFKGNVSLGGHSLGSVILYDLLCHQLPELPKEVSQEKSPSEKTYVTGTAGTGQGPVKYPQLEFSPAALYALGSPIAIFECIRGVESLGKDFALPTCKHFFNIFHPYDPIAYRIEPLINPQLQEVKPSQIPHHKGRKRMHLELKDTMARVGADLKQKLIESLRTTWNKWKASPPTDGQLEKVVEEEMEKEQLCEDGKEEVSEVQATPEMLGHLNSGRRIDYVLQEAPLEMINEYLFAMSSHVGYWESEDTMLLMLREIYSSLGVQPDSTVPQQSMTVERTRTLGNQDEVSNINEKDYPSTSRGGT